MPVGPESPGSRFLAWSMLTGGCICLVLGGLVLVKSPQPLIHKSIILWASIFLLAAGSGDLLEAPSPSLSIKLKFIAKVSVGLILFSLSWALSHP